MGGRRVRGKCVEKTRGGFGFNCVKIGRKMSQDSEEIKTIEQWKWSEMQGLELVVSAASSEDSSFKPNNSPSSIIPTPLTATHTNTQTAQEREERAGERDMDGSEGNTGGGGGGGGGGSGPSGDGEKPGSPPPAVGFGELFRFADGLDYVLMGIGSLGAIVHGSSLPLFLRFFADLVNSFGSYANDVDKMTQEVLKVWATSQHHVDFHSSCCRF